MLELWGADRHEQIRLFGERVLPHFRRVTGRMLDIDRDRLVEYGEPR